jgi:hypothetical protein
MGFLDCRTKLTGQFDQPEPTARSFTKFSLRLPCGRASAAPDRPKRSPESDEGRRSGNEFFAHSLHTEKPVTLPLLPASSLGFVYDYMGGLLVGNLVDVDSPLGSLPPRPLTDVSFDSYLELQSRP